MKLTTFINTVHCSGEPPLSTSAMRLTLYELLRRPEQSVKLKKGDQIQN